MRLLRLLRLLRLTLLQVLGPMAQQARLFLCILSQKFGHPGVPCWLSWMIGPLCRPKTGLEAETKECLPSIVFVFCARQSEIHQVLFVSRDLRALVLSSLSFADSSLRVRSHQCLSSAVLGSVKAPQNGFLWYHTSGSYRNLDPKKSQTSVLPSTTSWPSSAPDLASRERVRCTRRLRISSIITPSGARGMIWDACLWMSVSVWNLRFTQEKQTKHPFKRWHQPPPGRASASEWRCTGRSTTCFACASRCRALGEQLLSWGDDSRG